MADETPLLQMDRELLEKRDDRVNGILGQPINSGNDANIDFSMEDSPSYEILSSHNLLTKKYRVLSESELVLEEPNSNRIRNTLLSLVTCPCFCFGFSKGFEVPSGSLKTAYDGRGNYKFYGPGVHQILDPYYTVSTKNDLLSSQLIQNGDRTIVTVDQGYIGFCMERGQPILLPPGMYPSIHLFDLHFWDFSTYIISCCFSILTNNSERYAPMAILNIEIRGNDWFESACYQAGTLDLVDNWSRVHSCNSR